MNDGGLPAADRKVKYCIQAGCCNAAEDGNPFCATHKPKGVDWGGQSHNTQALKESLCQVPGCGIVVEVGTLCPHHKRAPTGSVGSVTKSAEPDDGRKYLRMIFPAAHLSARRAVVVSPDKVRRWEGFEVDVYRVIEAFRVTCPAVQHALKKLLCGGLRGKGSGLQDLQEAVTALHQAVDMQMVREAGEAPDPNKPLEP